MSRSSVSYDAVNDCWVNEAGERVEVGPEGVKAPKTEGTLEAMGRAIAGGSDTALDRRIARRREERRAAASRIAAFGYEVRWAGNGGWLVIEAHDPNGGRYRGDPIAAFSNFRDLVR